MFYLGIDIGKFSHEACIINDEDNLSLKSLKFSNDDKGYLKLKNYINLNVPTDSTLKISMEATRSLLAKYLF